MKILRKNIASGEYYIPGIADQSPTNQLSAQPTKVLGARRNADVFVLGSRRGLIAQMGCAFTCRKLGEGLPALYPNPKKTLIKTLKLNLFQ